MAGTSFATNSLRAQFVDEILRSNYAYLLKKDNNGNYTLDTDAFSSTTGYDVTYTLKKNNEISFSSNEYNAVVALLKGTMWGDVGSGVNGFLGKLSLKKLQRNNKMDVTDGNLDKTKSYSATDLIKFIDTNGSNCGNQTKLRWRLPGYQVDKLKLKARLRMTNYGPNTDGTQQKGTLADWATYAKQRMVHLNGKSNQLDMNVYYGICYINAIINKCRQETPTKPAKEATDKTTGNDSTTASYVNGSFDMVAVRCLEWMANLHQDRGIIGPQVNGALQQMGYESGKTGVNAFVEDVKKLQTQLGFTGTAIDGRFGRNTSNKLAQSGYTQTPPINAFIAWKNAQNTQPANPEAQAETQPTQQENPYEKAGLINMGGGRWQDAQGNLVTDPDEYIKAQQQAQQQQLAQQQTTDTLANNNNNNNQSMTDAISRGGGLSEQIMANKLKQIIESSNSLMNRVNKIQKGDIIKEFDDNSFILNEGVILPKNTLYENREQLNELRFLGNVKLKKDAKDYFNQWLTKYGLTPDAGTQIGKAAHGQGFSWRKMVDELQSNGIQKPDIDELARSLDGTRGTKNGIWGGTLTGRQNRISRHNQHLKSDNEPTGDKILHPKDDERDNTIATLQQQVANLTAANDKLKADNEEANKQLDAANAQLQAAIANGQNDAQTIANLQKAQQELQQAKADLQKQNNDLNAQYALDRDAWTRQQAKDNADLQAQQNANKELQGNYDALQGQNTDLTSRNQQLQAVAGNRGADRVYRRGVRRGANETDALSNAYQRVAPQQTATGTEGASGKDQTLPLNESIDRINSLMSRMNNINRY